MHNLKQSACAVKMGTSTKLASSSVYKNFA